MLAPLALVLGALGSADAPPPSTAADALGSTLPPLTVLGAPVRSARLGHGGGALLRAAATEANLARSLGPAAQRGAQQAPASGDAAVNAGAGAAPADAPTDAPAAAEEDEVDISALRVRSAITRTHRALGIATVASVGVTTILGTILTVNQATLFSPREMVGGVTLYRGACEQTDAMGNALGVACGELSTIHRMSAIVSVGLYATTGGFALAMPDPERVNSTNDRRGIRLRIHKIMAWTHLTGMILQPILGILAVSPNLVGLGAPAMGQSLNDFRTSLNTYQASMRTVHEMVGFVTFAALSTAMVVELIP